MPGEFVGDGREGDGRNVRAVTPGKGVHLYGEHDKREAEGERT